MKKIYAIHEAGGKDITFQSDVAYSLTTGGGKPGQGYPCILEVRYDRTVGAAKQSEQCRDNE